MAILPAIFGLIGRWVGRILNTAFSWATIMLFGKVPQRRQIFLSILSFGSVAWLIVLLGVIFPSVATFLLAFVTLPAWVNDNMVRLAMLAAAVLIPPIIGFVSLFVLDPEDRPQGAAAKAKTILKGYLFTAGLAITLLMMTIAAPLMRLPIILKRWSTQHVPMVVEANDYLSVVEEIQRALETAGYETSRHPVSWMMRFPTKILTAVAGGTIQNLVADNLTTLKARNLEVMLHPSDLVINGKEADLVHARAAVAQQLAFSRAYMSWTKEAQEIEDRLTKLWHGLQSGDRAYATGTVAKELQTVEQDLGKIKLPFEEWEVLMRKKLLDERGALQVAAGLVDRPPDLTDAQHDQLGGKQLQKARPLPQRLLTPRAAVLALIGLFTWSKLKPHPKEPERHLELERIF
jgi:uncharacterized protein YqgV (UPF0045/DUF77 family)